jgi:hypothetical protein
LGTAAGRVLDSSQKTSLGVGVRQVFLGRESCDSGSLIYFVEAKFNLMGRSIVLFAHVSLSEKG